MLRKTLRIIVLSLAVSALAAPAATAAPTPLDLELLGRTAAGGEATAEISAFDPRTERVFATDADNDQLDVFDFSDPSAPSTSPRPRGRPSSPAGSTPAKTTSAPRGSSSCRAGRARLTRRCCW